MKENSFRTFLLNIISIWRSKQNVHFVSSHLSLSFTMSNQMKSMMNILWKFLEMMMFALLVMRICGFCQCLSHQVAMNSMSGNINFILVIYQYSILNLNFRTTFTVDSRGEHAIQEMLLTHPLAASGRMTINNGIPRLILFFPHWLCCLFIVVFFHCRNIYPNRHRRDYSATSFRRSIYAQNLWVTIMPDFTGRYRDCSPTFFR